MFCQTGTLKLNISQPFKVFQGNFGIRIQLLQIQAQHYCIRRKRKTGFTIEGLTDEQITKYKNSSGRSQ